MTLYFFWNNPTHLIDSLLFLLTLLLTQSFITYYRTAILLPILSIPLAFLLLLCSHIAYRIPLSLIIVLRIFLHMAKPLIFFIKLVPAIIISPYLLMIMILKERPWYVRFVYLRILNLKLLDTLERGSVMVLLYNDPAPLSVQKLYRFCRSASIKLRYCLERYQYLVYFLPPVVFQRQIATLVRLLLVLLHTLVHLLLKSGPYSVA